jgi:hypothetical protein
MDNSQSCLSRCLSKKITRRLHLLLHYRLVPPSLVGLADVRRDGEPNLCMEVSVKIVFSSSLS